jgi:diaminopimelate epimerase
MPSIIPFVKAHGCGNDFLMIDAKYADGQLANLTKHLCDRNRGIGADGVEWLFPSEKSDILARLFNADGSEAEISGNGTRCVAAHLASQSQKKVFMIDTAAGVKACTLVSRADHLYQFSARMGVPQVRKGLTLQLKDRSVSGLEINIGNPHFVVIGPVPEDWKSLGAIITNHPHFREGTNIEFVTMIGENEANFCIYERGVGPTSSSGTGSCATATAVITMGLAQSPVVVKAEGGAQKVYWQNELVLEGPAEIVCRGEYFASNA